MTMSQNADARGRSPSAIARFTEAVFGVVPMSLAMLVLRITLALPFWRAGMTDWDGFGTVSFGAIQRFNDFRLHIFGAEIPYPAPEVFATLSSVAEVTLPVLLIFGFATRYAALALLGMTAIIQLTEPDGWANFHLPWAAMALAIMTFGPGKIALDYVVGLDRSFRGE
jgi:putative oxidoreductase